MAFVTQMLAAAECEYYPRPFQFTVRIGDTLRKVVMTHTLALAILDRFMGIDQGCYYLHKYPWINQRDVGPTPLCPDPSQDAFCHPLVHINCDARWHYEEDLLATFQDTCYPCMASLRKLMNLPPHVKGHVEASAWGLIYPLSLHPGLPRIWYFNYPPCIRPWPFMNPGAR